MSLIDWAAAWNPVPDSRPCRVWLPAEAPAGGAPAPRPDRPPRPIVLTLDAADAHHLPSRLPALLAQTDVRLGDAVTVDLASAASVHLTGLELLLTVLWRRVGPSGDVALVGGTPGLRAQLRSLGISAGASRLLVHGPLPDGAVARRAEDSRPLPPVFDIPVLDIPAPRRPLEPPTGERHAGAARLVLAGEVNLTADLRTQARLHELLEPPTRVLEVDLSDVADLSLSTLRLLVQADARLRARGGRVVLRRPGPSVQRLLAVTALTHLADDHPRDGGTQLLPHCVPQQQALQARLAQQLHASS